MFAIIFQSLLNCFQLISNYKPRNRPLFFLVSNETILYNRMVLKIPANLHSHLSLKFVKHLKLGDLLCARQLFDKITEPSLKLWTILITAYTKQNHPEEALHIYSKLRNATDKPDQFALLAAVKACAKLGDIETAKKIHDDVLECGFSSNLVLGNAIIDMYGKCKCYDGARGVFDYMEIKDVISWTSMCSCYVNCGLAKEAIDVVRKMGLNGVRPNMMTVSSLLPACAHLKLVNFGREVHGYVLRNGMEGNVFVSSALVDVYATCLRIKQAELVFYGMQQQDIVAWNVLISGYFTNGECDKGLQMFSRMRREGFILNYDTWNAVIVGCMQSGRTQQSLDLARQMQQSGFRPNRITITGILQACTHSENLQGGKEIHGYLFRNQLVDDKTASTALVFMYAKCGYLELSHKVFSTMLQKDTIAWNTIIMANSMHGKGVMALSLFSDMIKSGFRPNSVSFTSVLCGCNHSRLVDDGLTIFNSMTEDYGIEPGTEHFSALVDILSRAGRLEDAYKFILQMPIKPSASAWGALLAACRTYKNVDLGRIAANQLFQLEPQNPGNYSMFYNILVAAKLYEEASEARKLMRDRGIRKVPGQSWIMVNNKMYTFVVGDKNNVQIDEIVRFLKEMGEKIRLAGYIPDTDFVLQDLDKEEKEDRLCNHSERLAIAFGILNLKGKSSIRVFKNLRICGDCHSAIKFMTKIIGVKIVVRDSFRFHHFSNGLCSCGDFW
ncbi:hypothetical protein LIER_32027 [Lithospermum erythrorhizon]|uniref:DYW domain-containing protein n=1 Tax=Lithospermum erythrorhizon TaxID=34254 RepID=A0AAV3RUX3_LITER